MNILLIVLVILAGIAGLLTYLNYIYRSPDMSRFDQPQAPLVITEGEISVQHEEVLKKLAAYHADPTDIRDIPARRKMFDALFTVTDATMSSPTWQENLETDPFLGPSIGQLLKAPGLVRKIVGRIQSGKPGNHPELSPLFGRLDNLPPTLIQVSKHEMLYGDSQRYANKAAHEGSQVILQVWPKLVHVFQIFSFLPETDDALNRKEPPG